MILKDNQCNVPGSVYLLMIIAAKDKRADVGRLTQEDISVVCNMLRWPDTGKDLIINVNF